MNRYQKRRLVFIVAGILLIYFIFLRGYNEYKIEGVIKNAKAEDVWEYAADFSKMKLLNPTILDFRITADAGTYDHWTYSVVYKEKLSHWPYWINVGYADYVVRKFPKSVGETMVIDSKHKTCFLAGFYCLYSIGEQKFENINQKDTYYMESVQYQCPPLMGKYCKEEVEFQRKAIMHNLTTQFSQT
ncbi:uncharacterized protein LOC129609118 [Condylostylus longicornis]|uniref:uncharacterized protein LOC129609118 n=1 Tax=Condylostylus longicornis TaxID=2530218 RepID=UPI00244E16AA|nr:uncharacterized protein LOC129609118 [Condylostylus longicornis]